MTQQEFQTRYKYNPSVDFLGEGGFGKVFKAYDNHLDKWVAIKMAEVKPGLEQVRLKHEVEIVNKLPTHSNIARYEECYTFSSFTGEYDFAILQYYESGNLQQLLETKQLSEKQKDSILRQMLTGIEFLHNQGIIHRDLKPQNILIVNRNGEYIPKITDFGISKKLDVNKSTFFTNSIAGIGTLAYASPEQLRGQTIKKNTDLWSFGVLACWIFTGKLPFNSGNHAVTSEAGRIELFKQITIGDVTVIISQIPSGWRNVVKQCLLVDVEKRISGAEKCLEILSGVINQNNIEVPTSYKNSNSTTIINTQKTVLIDSKISNNETVTDIDGNVYNTVKLGSHVWLSEPLKVTHYQNGDPIDSISDIKSWGKLWGITFGRYLKTNNGHNYNWYAVSDKRNISPEGWHVANMYEWDLLVKYIKRNNFDIQQFKLLLDNNSIEHYVSGFFEIDKFYQSKNNACFWMNHSINDEDAFVWCKEHHAGLTKIGDEFPKIYVSNKYSGYCVACVKD